MVGLGAGARSYTRALHYGTDYAVSAPAVREAIEAWTCRATTRSTRRGVDHGIALDLDEQRRRWALQTLLGDGLDRAAYARPLRHRRRSTSSRSSASLLEPGLATVDGVTASCSPRPASSAPTPSARGCSRRRCARAWRLRARADAPRPDDAVPRAARELQLRLPILPLREGRRSGATRSPRIAAALARFVAWVAARGPRRIARGLLHAVGRGSRAPWYREALARLSRLPRVDAGGDPDEPLRAARRGSRARTRPRLALWCDLPPRAGRRGRASSPACPTSARAASPSRAESSGSERFVGEIEALRRALPPDVYLWVNAYKGRWDEGYADAEIAQLLEAIDPHFSAQPAVAAPEPRRRRAAPARPWSRSTATARCVAATSCARRSATCTSTGSRTSSPSARAPTTPAAATSATCTSIASACTKSTATGSSSASRAGYLSFRASAARISHS